MPLDDHLSQLSLPPFEWRFICRWQSKRAWKTWLLLSLATSSSLLTLYTFNFGRLAFVMNLSPVMFGLYVLVSILVLVPPLLMVLFMVASYVVYRKERPIAAPRWVAWLSNMWASLYLVVGMGINTWTLMRVLGWHRYDPEGFTGIVLGLLVIIPQLVMSFAVCIFLHIEKHPSFTNT